MTNDEIRTAVNQVLRSGCFFVAPGGDLQIEYHPAAACPWELYRGHLLGRSQTRLEKVFECWNVNVCHQEPSLSGPLLSVKFTSNERVIYVCRNILMLGWEASEEAGRAILGRETWKWTAELVGTIPLAGVSGEEELRRRLSRCIFLAVVGTSRLPITSLESPLPGFSLGQLGYLPSRVEPGDQPLSSSGELIDQGLTTGLALIERAKLLEMVLRAARPADVTGLMKSFLDRWRAVGCGLDEIPPLMRMLFNHVALSPYTMFVENLAALLTQLARPGLLGAAGAIDIISYMLRHMARHLTAFDLVAFHNSGANYPDALMLDTLLRAYLGLIERHLDQFEGRADEEAWVRRMKCSRRRALRQAWLIRKQYEGLRVPDAPTSPGENLRVLPDPFVRVPDEQIRQPGKRRRILFAQEPVERLLTESSHRVLHQSMQDLQAPEELCELGMAVYLDRPLGIFKQPGEVDRTPMLAYESFSLSIAESRLMDFLQRGLLPSQDQYQIFLRRLHEGRPTRGFPVPELGNPERPGVVALEDARRAASDFLFLRTTRQSLHDFLSGYDFGPLQGGHRALVDWLFSAKDILLIRSSGIHAAHSGRPFLTVFDQGMQARVRLGLGQEVSTSIRYQEADGMEYLEQWLRVLSTGTASTGTLLEARDFNAGDLRLPPRLGQGPAPQFGPLAK